MRSVFDSHRDLPVSDAELPEDDDSNDLEEPSKTQRKRDHKQMQRVVGRLVDLPSKHLQRLGLEDSQLEQIAIGRTAKRAARQRQIRYLTRYLDAEVISAAARLLAELDGESESAKLRFRRLETWRDRLIAEGSDTVEEVLQTFSNSTLERQQLRNLVRSAQQRLARLGLEPASPEALQSTDPRMRSIKREMFRYLRDNIEEV